MSNSETKTLIDSLKLIEGTFSPKSTSDLLKKFINEKINYHKINRLILTEANHSDDTPYDNSRIYELQEDLLRLEEAIQYAKDNNKNFKLNSTINIEFVDH